MKLGIIPNFEERFMNNYSKQREAILNVLKENLIHPTAEEIYNLVIEKEPQISKSTVYRNINILVESGKIERLKMVIGPDRYDYLYEKHSHIICEKCGQVFDFYYNFDDEKISKEVLKQVGKNIDINSIRIYGICENCKSKIKK